MFYKKDIKKDINQLKDEIQKINEKIDPVYCLYGPSKSLDQIRQLVNKLNDIVQGRPNSYIYPGLKKCLDGKMNVFDSRISKLEKQNEKLQALLNEVIDYVYKENKNE